MKRTLPNKPTVPTAPTSLIDYALTYLRRQTGQLFGSQGVAMERPTSED